MLHRYAIIGIDLVSILHVYGVEIQSRSDVISVAKGSGQVGKIA